MAIIYLIHFAEKYQHAQHYLGSTDDLDKRVSQHLSLNTRSPLMRAVNEAGIFWWVVRTWPDEDRPYEYQLKKRHKSRDLCPVCNPRTWHMNANGGNREYNP